MRRGRGLRGQWQRTPQAPRERQAGAVRGKGGQAMVTGPWKGWAHWGIDQGTDSFEQAKSRMRDVRWGRGRAEEGPHTCAKERWQLEDRESGRSVEICSFLAHSKCWRRRFSHVRPMCVTVWPLQYILFSTLVHLLLFSNVLPNNQ